MRMASRANICLAQIGLHIVPGVYPDIRALALDSRNRGGMMTRRKW
ncbi:unnamed protein product, partial [Ascophyllum nodosum]